MNGSLKLLKILGILVAVAVAGVTVGYLVTKGKGDSSARPSADVTASANPKSKVKLPQRPAPTAVSPQPAPRMTVTGKSGNSNTSVLISPAATGIITNWEERLDDILGSDTDESDKARELLTMFPRLPEDGQVEVAQHLSNLIEDSDYPAFGNYLTNAAMPETVLDVLLSDALNRPNSLKLPLLLDVAQNPDNPKASEAKDLLELYLEEDYGNDWAKWRAKTEEWLKENPD